MRRAIGGLLLLGGAILLAAWGRWFATTLEEPPPVGKTPNPPRARWLSGPWDPWEWRLLTYGPPAAAGTLLLAGALLLGRRNPRVKT